MADKFLEGLMGGILQNQEAGQAANRQRAETELRLLGMESEGKIRKAPFANDPQGAIKLIGQMMGFQGPSLREQYQAVPLQEQKEAEAMGPRKDYFTVQNYIPGKGYLTHNAATNKFEIVSEQRGVGKTAPNISGDNAEFFAKAKTLSGVMADIDTLYQDRFVGPVAGRLGRAVDLYTPFGDADRSRFRNQVAKAFNTLVYLRSGKAINNEEANRLAEEFMAVNNTPVAFKSGWGAMKDELNSLVSSRQDTLQRSGYAFADQFQGYGQITGKQGSTPETAVNGSGMTPEARRARIAELRAKQGKK